MSNRNFDILDILSVFSIYLNVINYEENIRQSDFQHNIEDIHKHLQSQDEKIDSIIEILGGVK